LYKDDAGNSLHNYAWIFGGIIIGAIAGTLAAKKVKMDCYAGDGKFVLMVWVVPALR